MKNRHIWTDAEAQVLRARFPHERTRDVAQSLGLSASQVSSKAAKLGLYKSAEHLASEASGRLQKGGNVGAGSRFAKGNAAWNKGTHFVSGGRSTETQFKPGGLPWRTMPVGTYRINPDGYLERKYAERPGPPKQRWRAVHLLVWEAAHGPLPAGHAVCFLPGRKSTVLEHITLDALELVTRRELLSRNTVQRFPPELRQIIQLKGAVQRQINKRSRVA